MEILKPYGPTGQSGESKSLMSAPPLTSGARRLARRLTGWFSLKAQMKLFLLTILCVAFVATPTLAQSPADNSNFWPVYRDDQTGFRVSYPPGRVIAPAKGRNVRLSVNPPTGAGNCNVVARANAEIGGMSQPALSREIESRNPS